MLIFISVLHAIQVIFTVYLFKKNYMTSQLTPSDYYTLATQYLENIQPIFMS